MTDAGYFHQPEPPADEPREGWAGDKPQPVNAASEIITAIAKVKKLATEYQFAVDDEIERLLALLPTRPDPVCPSDPCPYCTAAVELSCAIIDLQDLVDP
jgi:hypothetical protein